MTIKKGGTKIDPTFKLGQLKPFNTEYQTMLVMIFLSWLISSIIENLKNQFLKYCSSHGEGLWLGGAVLMGGWHTGGFWEDECLSFTLGAQL